jgi:hypothetical protein
MTDWTITQARMMIDPAVPVDERNNFLLFPLPNTATLLLLHRFWSRMHDDTHGQSFLVSVKRSCQNTDAEDVNKERAQESPCCGDAVNPLVPCTNRNGVAVNVYLAAMRRVCILSSYEEKKISISEPIGKHENAYMHAKG